MDDIGTEFELDANCDSDVTSADSVGVRNINLDYSRSLKKFPASSYNILEPVENLDEFDKMHEEVGEELKGFSSPRELFDQPDESDPREIVNLEDNPSEQLLENGNTPPLLT